MPVKLISFLLSGQTAALFSSGGLVVSSSVVVMKEGDLHSRIEPMKHMTAAILTNQKNFLKIRRRTIEKRPQ